MPLLVKFSEYPLDIPSVPWESLDKAIQSVGNDPLNSFSTEESIRFLNEVEAEEKQRKRFYRRSNTESNDFNS